MGYPIIKQPDGKYAIYSTFSDSLMEMDLTREEVIKWYIDLAKQRAEQETKEYLDEIDQGRLKTSTSFREALKNHVRHERVDEVELNAKVKAKLEELKNGRVGKKRSDGETERPKSKD